ncbi:Uma2 family endonuclease [Limnoraphis robusta Tam1]|uniref:Uma2 family endonuclease n=1 Tax=Limnoraphis robusta TaxID=1118279 RepID=UPI002B219D7D|nr:Uma2 family endonuclease [Limnoraphis robusta]MEA5498212.1 Uma2 family endonuclease [Limnoraphis robusta BA-68 BA1]MEA5541444.1 Uma2 family endonuclease [Limnoraphis robusta Tam1]
MFTQIEEQKISLTLEEFLDWYPDGYEGRFELHDGEIVQMQPTGTHEQVAGFLASKLSVYIERLNLPFFIPRQGLIKAIDSDKSAYIPDVMVLDYNALENESLWKKRSTITQGTSIKLAIEVVSTNWRDDYLMKLGEYEKLGIAEYWIVDYLGLGGRRYIGDPKQPTILVYHLVEGEYMVNLFRGQDILRSPTFPELNLTAEQIFAVGQ